PFVEVDGHRLEYAWFGDTQASRETIVMLHEGLGSLALWRQFPERVAQASRRRVLAYSRYGYGGSDAIEGPRAVDFMHVEALSTLPTLLSSLDVDQPVLLGH